MQRVAGDCRTAQDGVGIGYGHAPILTCGATALLAGCRGPLSALDPAGPSAQAIAAVWWWMFGVSGVVLLAVCVLWLVAMRPRAPDAAATGAADGAADEERARRHGLRWIVGGGIVLPVAAITALLVFGTPAGRHQLPMARQAGAPLAIDVIAYRWGWEARYPGGAVLRDALTMPAGRPVDIRLQSRDVIHSFWIPRLGGKLDAVPGRTLVIRLQADQPGTYRGQCAEYCGEGHARMAFTVTAIEPTAFDAWLQAPMPAQAPR